ncbi:MAG: sugar phosphate isomerase/epimerase family protein [Armatimonadota bacterium]|nr:sugar phosphate isomerase/epimerase family protein [Armatimonadota bacterium]
MVHLGVTVAYARTHFQGEPDLAQHDALADWAARCGFAGIEVAAFSQEHLARDFSDLEALRRCAARWRDCGVAVSAFEAGFLRHLVISEDPATRRRATEGLKRSLEVARALGTDLVYFHSAPHPSWTVEIRRLYDDFSPPVNVEIPPTFRWEHAWAQYVNTIGTMAEVAAQARMRLAMEVRPYEMVSTADGARRLMEAAGSSALGVVFDTAHFFVQKEILPVAIEKLAGRIFLVHLADNDGVFDYHWAPGRGQVPWESTLRALRKVGYQGFANIDVAGTYDDIDGEICFGRDFIRPRMSAWGQGAAAEG